MSFRAKCGVMIRNTLFATFARVMSAASFPDSASYAAYTRRGGTLERDDWRRHSVDTLIQQIYQRTKASGMYDSSLQMYRLSESLETMGQDVGRTKAFTPGWLENQSIWLHMSYKFYLELLRGGLYTQFYDEIATGLVPFMDNKVYGRSPLEAASFIVSSAFPDKKLHGASFLARLSGSTAEFLSMWSMMMAGETPFSLGPNGTLQLALSPALPGWLFTEEGTVTFTFLGEVQVTYYNPSKADTWTLTPRTITVVYKDNSVSTFSDSVLRDKVAVSVRNLEVSSLAIRY